MSLPTTFDPTPRYLALFPPRVQVGALCVPCSRLNAMEMCGILASQPVVQLSQLFENFNHSAQTFGVCAEQLWPASLSYGPDTATTGISDAVQQQIALGTRPSAAAFADAPNHKLLEYGDIQGGTWVLQNGSMVFQPSDVVLEMKTEIAAGHPVMCGMRYESHELCVWGYDSTGWLGLDSRSASPIPFHYSYAELTPDMVVRSVSFTGPTSYPTIYPAYGFGPVVPSPPTGNTQMLIDNIKAAGNALVLNSVTQAQIDAGKALWAQLVADATAPIPVPTPPPPAGTSAPGTTITPGSGTINDGSAVWRINAAPRGLVLRNENDLGANGFWAAKMVWTGVRNEAQNQDNGSWSYWNGSRWLGR
jgi:hypothetical protein